jgi:hypothetical protein
VIPNDQASVVNAVPAPLIICGLGCDDTSAAVSVAAAALAPTALGNAGAKEEVDAAALACAASVPTAEAPSSAASPARGGRGGNSGFFFPFDKSTAPLAPSLVVSAVSIFLRFAAESSPPSPPPDGAAALSFAVRSSAAAACGVRGGGDVSGSLANKRERERGGGI